MLDLRLFKLFFDFLFKLDKLLLNLWIYVPGLPQRPAGQSHDIRAALSKHFLVVVIISILPLYHRTLLGIMQTLVIKPRAASSNCSGIVVRLADALPCLKLLVGSIALIPVEGFGHVVSRRWNVGLHQLVCVLGHTHSLLLQVRLRNRLLVDLGEIGGLVNVGGQRPLEEFLEVISAGAWPWASLVFH